jgi:PIN domain nuclease of toxin-antitoxin system
MIYVTDTHPLVWFLVNSPRLSPVAHRAFTEANARIVVPTIVLVEIKFLSTRRRITVDLPRALAHIDAAANSLIHPLDVTIVKHLPTTFNIHDAIIVGTAMMYRDELGESVALITKDAEITASGLVQVVW